MRKNAIGRKGVCLFREYSFIDSILNYFLLKFRVWWIFAFALALYYCGTLIHNVYIKWDQSPVIVSFAEKSTPVWEIPFPAVTICPETKANMTQLNFTEVFHKMASASKPPYNITDDECVKQNHFHTSFCNNIFGFREELMAAVVQICDSHITEGFDVGKNFTDSSITELLKDVSSY